MCYNKCICKSIGFIIHRISQYGVSMKVLRFITQKILYPTGLIYTALTMVLLMFITLIDNDKPAITLHTAFSMLLIALLISGANLLFSLRQFSLLTRTLLHFPTVLIAIVAVLLFDGSYDLTVNSLVLIILYTVLYALIVPPYLLIGTKLYQNEKEEKTYTSIFSPRE